MALLARITGTVVAYGKKSFKNKDGEVIEFSEITLIDPTDQYNPTQTFSVNEKCAKDNAIDLVGDVPRPLLGKTVILDGELSSNSRKITFTVDEKPYTKYTIVPKFKVFDLNFPEIKK